MALGYVREFVRDDAGELGLGVHFLNQTCKNVDESTGDGESVENGIGNDGTLTRKGMGACLDDTLNYFINIFGNVSVSDHWHLGSDNHVEIATHFIFHLERQLVRSE